MSTYRLATVALALACLVALGGCSSLGFGDSCDVCEAPAPACAPAPAPVCAPAPAPICAPAPAVAPAMQRPPAANPGEVWCYVRIPAVTRTVQEQVCIQPETCRQEWVPPETKQVCEQICVKPEEVRQIPVPARYETVSEQVMTCPGKTEWRRVDCDPKSLGSGEQLGECWTLAEVPPVYETRSHQVCVQPESCRQEMIPAVYESQTKTVTVREGFYKSIPVPAVYETRSREEMVAPARWEWRRTHECEVPGMMGAPAPAPMGGMTDMPAPAPDYGYGTQPIDVPPAGTLPQADPFAPSR